MRPKGPSTQASIAANKGKSGRREFLAKVGQVTLGSGACTLLAALMADRVWADVTPCGDPHQCTDPYHWHCEPPEDYYSEGYCPIPFTPPYACVQAFGCELSVICDDFECGDVQNAYGCTGRMFTCQQSFTCNRNTHEFNCGTAPDGTSLFSCNGGSQTYHNRCPC